GRSRPAFAPSLTRWERPWAASLLFFREGHYPRSSDCLQAKKAVPERLRVGHAHRTRHEPLELEIKRSHPGDRDGFSGFGDSVKARGTSLIISQESSAGPAVRTPLLVASLRAMMQRVPGHRARSQDATRVRETKTSGRDRCR